MFRKLSDKKNIQILVAIILIMGIIWFLTQIGGTVFPLISTFIMSIAPFVLGMIFAFLLNPFVQDVSNRLFKGRKSLGILVTFVVLISLLLFVIYPIFRDVFANFTDIISYLRSATSILLDSVDAINADLKTQILNYISSFGTTMTQVVFGSVNNIATASMQTFLTLIITVFALAEYDHIIVKFTTFFKKDKRPVVIEYIRGLEQQFYYYLRSLVISFVISTIVFGLVLYILGIHNALSFAIIMSLLIVLIPIIGPFVATAILAVITIPVSTVAIIVGFVGLFLFMQLFINIISPRIYAQTLNLSNLLIIVSFLIGNALLGIAGALFAIPALIFIVYTYKFLEKQGYWSEKD